MIPSIRAIADRLILDTANVKYIAASLPGDALDRSVLGGEWTVRQLIHHLGSATMGAAEALERATRGEQLLPDAFTPEEFNRRAAEESRSMPLSEILGLLDAARDRMLRALEAVPQELLPEMFGRHTLLELVTDWSLHYVQHGLDFADALPELRHDPMVLNWLLHADYSDSGERTARQAKLLAEVREMHAAFAEGH
jgi:hypothetical protein